MIIRSLNATVPPVEPVSSGPFTESPSSNGEPVGVESVRPAVATEPRDQVAAGAAPARTPRGDLWSRPQCRSTRPRTRQRRRQPARRRVYNACASLSRVRIRLRGDRRRRRAAHDNRWTSVPPAARHAVADLQRPLTLRDSYGPDLKAASGQIPMAADTVGHPRRQGAWWQSPQVRSWRTGCSTRGRVVVAGALAEPARRHWPTTGPAGLSRSGFTHCRE
jgi:hypothetical protein